MAVELTTEVPVAPEPTDRIVALRPAGGTANEKTVVLDVGPLVPRWVSALGAITGANNINLNTANLFSARIAGSVTFSFINPLPSGQLSIIVLFLSWESPDIGGTVTWPASVDFGTDGAPELPTTGGTVQLCFISRDGGASWTGTLDFVSQD